MELSGVLQNHYDPHIIFSFLTDLSITAELCCFFQTLEHNMTPPKNILDTPVIYAKLIRQRNR